MFWVWIFPSMAQSASVDGLLFGTTTQYTTIYVTTIYDHYVHYAPYLTVSPVSLSVFRLCGRLPASHGTLLCHMLCVLHYIARRSHHNLMSAANVAVCVGPSLLAPANPAQVLTSDNAKLMPSVVEFLIEHCAAIFGAEVLGLFGPPPEREVRTDSGAEESDSLHSCEYNSGRGGDGGVGWGGVLTVHLVTHLLGRYVVITA